MSWQEILSLTYLLTYLRPKAVCCTVAVYVGKHGPSSERFEYELYHTGTLTVFSNPILFKFLPVILTVLRLALFQCNACVLCVK